MEEARIIARLRRGEREALSGLQEEWRDAVWTVCLAMTPTERDAQALVQSVWKALREEARTWSATASLRSQVAGLVCRVIARKLGLPQPGEGLSYVPSAERLVAAHELQDVLAGVPPATLLVFLTDLFFECPVDALSAFVAVPAPALRAARAAVYWRLVPRDRVDRRAWSRELELLPDYVADDLPHDLMDRVSAALDDPSLEALADQLAAARETCRAVLESKAPSPVGPIEVASADLRDPIGAVGGLLLAAFAVLASLLFLSTGVNGRPGAALSGVLAGHAAALGHAPGFVPTSDPVTLERALVQAGVSPASASVDDWTALRFRLKGGLPSSGAAGAVALFSVDGRPLTVTSLPWLDDPGAPRESWSVMGARLIAYDEGDTGVVVLREPATGRVRVFASPMAAEQLLALLAYGIKLQASSPPQVEP